MGGTRAGGSKARDKNLAKYGSDFYSKVGAIGGKKGTTGGFHYLKEHDPEKLKELSAKGGRKSTKPFKDPL